VQLGVAQCVCAGVGREGGVGRVRNCDGRRHGRWRCIIGMTCRLTRAFLKH
jgi:hypothetical protein